MTENKENGIEIRFVVKKLFCARCLRYTEHFRLKGKYRSFEGHEIYEFVCYRCGRHRILATKEVNNDE